MSIQTLPVSATRKTVETEPRPGVLPSARAEAEELADQGYDVSLTDPSPRFELEDEVQQRVSRAISEQAGIAGFTDWLFNPEYHPSGAAWHGVAKRAIALHTLYNIGRIECPHDGVERGSLEQSIFRDGTACARELILEQHGPGKADRILARYDRFFDAVPVQDDRDEYGLTSYDYLLGVVDSHAVRTRADAAKAMVREHFAGVWRPELRIASVACGAAEPVYELATELALDGHSVVGVELVDHDPVALATFAGLAHTHGLSGRVRTHFKSFLRTPLNQIIEPGSVDVVDLIGVFEHIPTSRAGYRFAANLLTSAAAILRRGGVVVLGNMLPDRPQQEFFSSVWPSLHQRSITEVLRLFGEAGFDPERVSVRVPAREGVYGVYLAEIQPDTMTRPSATQRGIGRILLRAIPEL